MSEQFLGEIRLVSFAYPPQGWAFCNGQMLPISQNQALFALLGTTFGGNGVTTFALPNLQGASPIHPGNGITNGQSGGEALHVLTIAEVPAHTHQAVASDADTPSAGSPAGAYWANQQSTNAYGTTPNSSMPGTAQAGGAQGHPNMQPFLGLNFIIATTGIFPSRN